MLAQIPFHHKVIGLLSILLLIVVVSFLYSSTSSPTPIPTVMTSSQSLSGTATTNAADNASSTTLPADKLPADKPLPMPARQLQKLMAEPAMVKSAAESTALAAKMAALDKNLQEMDAQIAASQGNTQTQPTVQSSTTQTSTTETSTNETKASDTHLSERIQHIREHLNAVNQPQ
jgi:hypothetical protein